MTGRPELPLLIAGIAAANILLGCSSDPAIGSIGAVLVRDTEEATLYVRETPRGLAAQDAGLLPGDQIIMIDGMFIRQLDAVEIRDRLRGDVGTPVSLTIVRGDEILHLEVVRGPLREASEVAPKVETLQE